MGAEGQANHDLGECAEHEVLLLVDGELSAADRLRVQSHVDRCAPCAAEVLRLGRLKARIRASGVRPPAPESLRRNILRQLDHEPCPVHPRTGIRFRPVPVAVGATALGIAAWLWGGRTGDDVIRDLVARHARRLPLEFESSDPGATEKWLSDKVDFKIRVPQPVRHDLSLVGARLSHVGTRDAVQLTYGSGRPGVRRASVVIFEDPEETARLHGTVRQFAGRAFVTGSASGFNLAQWNQEQVVYSLVAEEPNDVIELMRAVQP